MSKKERHVKERQARMKDRYDDHAQQVEYQVGDTVWIYVPAFQTGLSRKLMKFWTGPLLLVEQTGPVKSGANLFQERRMLWRFISGILICSRR